MVLPGLTELILNAQDLLLVPAFFLNQNLGHGAAQTAVNTMFLKRNHPAVSSDSLEEIGFVDGLDGADMDYCRIDIAGF